MILKLREDRPATIEEHSDLRAVERAAEALLARLDEVEAHPSYQGVWTFARARGYRYEGPGCDGEVEALRAALAKRRSP